MFIHNNTSNKFATKNRSACI